MNQKYEFYINFYSNCVCKYNVCIMPTFTYKGNIAPEPFFYGTKEVIFSLVLKWQKSTRLFCVCVRSLLLHLITLQVRRRWIMASEKSLRKSTFGRAQSKKQDVHSPWVAKKSEGNRVNKVVWFSPKMIRSSTKAILISLFSRLSCEKSINIRWRTIVIVRCFAKGRWRDNRLTTMIFVSFSSQLLWETMTHIFNPRHFTTQAENVIVSHIDEIGVNVIFIA